MSVRVGSAGQRGPDDDGHIRQTTAPAVCRFAGVRHLARAARMAVRSIQNAGRSGGIQMATARVFTSFDYDNDFGLKAMLIGQAKHPDTPFVLADWSVKDHMTGDWKEKVRTRIRSVDQVVVLCGQYTHKATGVAVELEIAREERKPYFLLAGYSDRDCTRPTTAASSDKMYKWTWENLKNLIGGAR